MPIPGRMEDVFEGYYKTIIDRRIEMFAGKDIVRFGIVALTSEMADRISDEYQKLGWTVDFEKRSRLTWFTFIREGADLQAEEEEQVEEPAEDDPEESEVEQDEAVA